MNSQQQQSSYDSLASVYDDWWGHFDADDAVAYIAAQANAIGAKKLLEIGVGTGRVAIPLAHLGYEVTGVDVSPEMVARLSAKAGGSQIRVHVADIGSFSSTHRFGIVYAAFNSILYATSDGEAQSWFDVATAHLEAGGLFITQTHWGPATNSTDLVVERVHGDTAVLKASQTDPSTDVTSQLFIELSDDRIRTFPCTYRNYAPAQLDGFAKHSGLQLVGRSEGWANSESSDWIVSVYRRD